MNFECTITIPETVIRWFLEAGIESGINHWTGSDNPLLRTLWSDSQQEILNRDVINRGLTAMIKNEAHFMDLAEAAFGSGTDSYVADTFIQYCLFGEVRYEKPPIKYLRIPKSDIDPDGAKYDSDPWGEN